MNMFTEGSAWEQCSVDDCNTSGPQEHDCCNQNSMDTVGIPTVQMDREGCPWKSTVQAKSNTSSFLPYLILPWDTIINTCYVSLTCGIDEID